MPSSAELVCVDPKLISQVWPHVRPLLEAATKRTGISNFEDIEFETLRGGGLLWLASRHNVILGAATTVLQIIAGKKVCVLTACGGTGGDEWLHLISGIEDYARAEDCACVRIFGRKGWARVLNSYDVTNYVMERRL